MCEIVPFSGIRPLDTLSNQGHLSSEFSSEIIKISHGRKFHLGRLRIRTFPTKEELTKVQQVSGRI